MTYNRLITRLLSICCAFVMLFVTSLASALSYNPEAEQAITDAAYRFDKPALQHLLSEAEGYNEAYALYRLAALNYTGKDTQLALGQLRKVASLLEREEDAEAKVLRAAALSMAMGLDAEGADQIAPLVHTLLAEAKANPTASARAHLVKDIVLFYTPPAFGGGMEPAKKEVNTAIQAFELGNNSDVTWGHAEAYVWLGQLLAASDKAGAAKAYDTALALNPNCLWAKELQNGL